MMQYIAVAMGWILAIFLALVAYAILRRIFDDRIDLSKLLSEKDDTGASLSRFQFLIFTFVISMSLFLIVVGESPPRFPKSIPGEVLALLGISGASYVVSKAVQKGDKGKEGRPPSPKAPGTTAMNPPDNAGGD